MKKENIIAVLIILFLISTALGIIFASHIPSKGEKNKPKTIPKTLEGNSHKVNDHKTSQNQLKEKGDVTMNIPINKKDQDVNRDIPPDEKYYKQAKILHKEFPDTFIMSHDTKEKRLALTFDDGPDSISTPKILDILKENDALATFFILGQNANRFPQLMERIADEGHQIANHSWSHLRPTQIENNIFLKEVLAAEETILDYEKKPGKLYYRPPYGLLTHEQIETMRHRGYRIISWSIDSLDWAGSPSDEIKEKVTGSAHPGAIVLMHCSPGKNGESETVKALPRVIKNLRDQGYELVTVDTLLKGD